MKSSNMAVLASCAACFLLMGCETPQTEGGEKVAKVEAYAPTGTFIPRKNGSGLGPAQIETVRKQDLENQRTMGSSGHQGAGK